MNWKLCTIPCIKTLSKNQTSPRFDCFHYKHRREDGSKDTRCCLVRIPSRATAEAFARAYDGRRWLAKATSSGVEVEMGTFAESL